MFNLFRQKPETISHTLKPSDEESVKLAELYDKWNAYGTMGSKVAFLIFARQVVKKHKEEIPIQFSQFNYDTENGYLTILENLP